MIKILKNIRPLIPKKIPVKLITRARLKELLKAEKRCVDIEFLRDVGAGKRWYQLLDVLDYSESQIRQDLFVLATLDQKHHGFFVEFGAASGRALSNTYLLEKLYGWKGILAEPARCWHHELRMNRVGPIETACIWKSSGDRLPFREVVAPELSTIDQVFRTDEHQQQRKSADIYEVDTISLEDLLQKYNAPKLIDYLSIDTEGSEYSVLEAFDFNRYSFSVITCEHNYTDSRELIFKLLSHHGYNRVHQKWSQFEDWYILDPDVVNNCLIT